MQVSVVGRSQARRAGVACVSDAWVLESAPRLLMRSVSLELPEHVLQTHRGSGTMSARAWRASKVSNAPLDHSGVRKLLEAGRSPDAVACDAAVVFKAHL